MREAAGDEPQAGLAGARIHVAQLLAVAKTPDGADALDDRVAEQFAHQLFLALVAGRQHDQIGGDGLAVLHPRALGDKAVDIGKLLQRDLALDDQIRAADVEIIAAAAGEIFELPAGVVFAEIELEADARQALEQILVELLRFLAGQRVAFPRHLQRHRGRDQIVVVQRALIVGRVDQLRRRLDADDQRRGALHQRHLGAARMQILRDVVAAVAGADHDRALALPVLAVVVLAGMQHGAAKIFQAGNVRHARNAADAGGQHDMARMHRALAAIGAAQRHGPALFFLVVAAALELGPGPKFSSMLST